MNFVVGFALICAAALAPQECTRDTARISIPLRQEQWQGILCGLAGQTIVAQSPFAREGEYVKVVCVLRRNMAQNGGK